MSVCVRTPAWGDEWHAFKGESTTEIGTKCGMRFSKQWRDQIEEARREPDCPDCREAEGLEPEETDG